MSDKELVDRLREDRSVKTDRLEAADYIEHCHASHDAMAKEIERLTRERDEAQSECKRLCKSRNRWGQKYNECLAKLRAAVFSDADYVAAVDEKAAEAVARADAAERKVENLREALDKLIKDMDERGIRHDDRRQQVARAALAETEKGDE